MLTSAVSSPPILEAVDRVKGVLTDVPGTQLSPREVARLSRLAPTRGEPIFEALIGVGSLTCGRTGRFRQVE